jgi:phosphoglycerate dehydrogenase-like enzyme
MPGAGGSPPPTARRKHMPKRKILVVSDSLHKIAAAMAALSTCGHDVEFVEGLIGFRDIARGRLANLAGADAIVMGRVMGTDAEALALCGRARVIALHTSGSDNVAIEAATDRGIVVTNVKGVNAEQCAEFSIGLMLAVTRQIRTGDIAIRAGRWAADTQSSLDMYGATLSVFGLGMIGKAAVRRAAAFGMKILVHTRTPDAAFGREYHLEYVGKDEALARADIVSLYQSLNPSTYRMIGPREFALMQPHAYLINIARGELVDEAALFEALATRRIAGAGLDVFEREPLYESPLFGLSNVVLTPHQAGLAQSAKKNAAVRAVSNALEVLAGRLPADAINPTAFAYREH